MANFSAADVKALRDRTGAGMLDCKNALVASEGDVEKAIEFIRIKGLKGVAKRGGRTTSDGLVTGKASDGYATLIELASETDFVAKNEKFIALAATVLDAVACGARAWWRSRPWPPPAPRLSRRATPRRPARAPCPT